MDAGCDFVISNEMTSNNTSYTEFNLKNILIIDLFISLKRLS
jgi:hypothetical protein